MGTVSSGLALALLVSGCGSSSSPASPPGSPSASISTLTPLPMPDTGPPAGKVVADLRQASRDAALNRFQVWIGNGLPRDLDPVRIRYEDPRFPAPIPGERLRLNPSGSERGYPLALPPRPVCSGPRHGALGTVSVTFAGRTLTVPVEDEADVVERSSRPGASNRRGRVAELSFLDAVPADSSGEEGVGMLTLVVRPRGTPGDGSASTPSAVRRC